MPHVAFYGQSQRMASGWTRRTPTFELDTYRNQGERNDIVKKNEPATTLLRPRIAYSNSQEELRGGCSSGRGSTNASAPIRRPPFLKNPIINQVYSGNFQATDEAVHCDYRPLLSYLPRQNKHIRTAAADTDICGHIVTLVISPSYLIHIDTSLSSWFTLLIAARSFRNKAEIKRNFFKLNTTSRSDSNLATAAFFIRNESEGPFSRRVLIPRGRHSLIGRRDST